ncbi:MAG: hypothetical protein HQL46_16550 [Gammaproteobacteria bacterium]|nr:hypothetical protein [Gammaproteobacteria bacterium]
MTTSEAFMHEFAPTIYEQYHFDQNENIGDETYFYSHAQDEQNIEEGISLEDLARLIA